MRRFIYLKVYCMLLLCSMGYLSFAESKPAPGNPDARIAKANEVTITGKVVSDTGEELVGVSVFVKGTTIGTITDVSGDYSLNAPDENGTLVFSFIGYVTQEVAIENQTTINVTLATDVTALEEIVVVGYGTQKKSVVTGAISSVKAKDLETMPVNNISQALQGRTAGLTIAASSGQPGSMATVMVRGITTLNNNNPLWVVDGVVIDNGGIGYLNQSDIESIEVLKDAASQAIYGARAAAGVILVTTKRGKSGKLRVRYNGFYGTSAPARKLDLLNATEYATIRNEASVAGGGNILFNDPASLGEGTDWQDAIFNNDTRRQNHEVSVSGGNDISTFYASFGYLDQEGIVATDISKYKRVNLRVNTTHKVTPWLKLGQNLGYSYEKSIGLGNTNSEFGGPLSSAINLDPLTPLVETDPAKINASPYTNVGIRKNAMGNPYGISSYVGQEMSNPLAYISTNLGNHGWSHNIVGNAYVEAEPIKGLVFRSTLGSKLAFYGNENFTPIRWLNPNMVTIQTSFTRNTNQVLNYNIENTLSYTKEINRHNISLLIGQGAYRDNASRGVGLTKYGIPVDNFDDASMNYQVAIENTAHSGYENAAHTVASLFARLTYNFGEKYLLNVIARRDGSSRFGSANKYGYFPSASAGWVASAEEFWPRNNVISFLKIRGGYGVVGNDNIGDFAYLSTISPGRNYVLGDEESFLVGWSPDAPANPNLRWEQTSQANIGFEATLLKSLYVNFDWYKKVTSDILGYPRIPAYVGAISNPAANVADMENTGVELEMGYTTRIGEVNFSLNGNITHLKNKVTYLGDGVEFLDGGAGFQSSTYPITRTMVGKPAFSFYGFKTKGIFQTPEEVSSHVNSEGTVIQPDAKPGDFIWEDKNDDGSITEADRSIIGNPTPNLIYGLTLNADYKGIDLVVFGQGAAGNDIFQGLRRLDIDNANYQTKALARWTGPGTSNEYPRIVNGDPSRNFSNPSDFHLEKGDYFRIKIIQLGYTLPGTIAAKAGLERVRIYLMSENLVTFTKYTGYDPEIGGGNILSIDRGIYPQARSFMAGINLSF